MYDAKGEKIWEANLDIYGKVRTFTGRSLSDCPFRYQGQYEDAETGLYYNRFRYYSPEEGVYLSQDPIGLWGCVQLYAYVHDPNSWIDEFGLFKTVTFPRNKVISQVTIKMQGSRDLDFKAANEAANIKGARGYATIKAHKKQHGDVTWYHAGYNPTPNEVVMQLVKTPDHVATLPHEGAVKHFEVATDTTYGSDEAIAKANELNSCH
jgi:RHS repeat-associated protein